MRRYTATAGPLLTGLEEQTLQDVVRWASQEFDALGALSLTFQDLDVEYEEPSVIQEGMIRYFGLGGFDPGHGPGAYCYSYVDGDYAWRPMFPI